MRPQWWPMSGVPFEDMWADDRHWFPIIAQDQCFQGKALFRGTEAMLDIQLSTVDVLDERYPETCGRYDAPA